MFKRIPSAPPGIIAFDAEGKITDSDYKTILVPAVEAAIKEHGKARILVRFGPEFETYTAHAMLDDAVFGTAHYTAFERIAMVTDIGWLANSMRFFAPFIPGKMRVFPLASLDEAMAWTAA
jgi:hypothetical protein